MALHTNRHPCGSPSPNGSSSPTLSGNTTTRVLISAPPGATQPMTTPHGSLAPPNLATVTTLTDGPKPPSSPTALTQTTNTQPPIFAAPLTCPPPITAFLFFTSCETTAQSFTSMELKRAASICPAATSHTPP